MSAATVDTEPRQERDGVDGIRMLDGQFAHYLPLRQCQPWCDPGDGHPHRVMAEDQVCISGNGPIPRAEPRHRATDDLDITVDCYHSPGESPAVNLWIYGDYGNQFIDADPLLTATEARALAAALTHAADLIEQSGI